MKHIEEIYEDLLSKWGKCQTYDEYINAANEAYEFSKMLKAIRMAHSVPEVSILGVNKFDPHAEFKHECFLSLYDAMTEEQDDFMAELAVLADKASCMSTHLELCGREAEEEYYYERIHTKSLQVRE